MKNNRIFTIASGLCFLASSIQAQNYSEKEMSLAYASTKKAPTIIYNTNAGVTASSELVEIVDYPTISFPETAGFTVEKEKATYHLSWNVLMRENLAYTEVQSSSDGVNFTTVGYVMNDNKNTNFDYFVATEKNKTSTFRLVQHGLNAQKHTSDILRVK